MEFHKELDVFYAITEYGTPVWGRLDEHNNATEIHPLYVRNQHSNFIAAIQTVYNNAR